MSIKLVEILHCNPDAEEAFELELGKLAKATQQEEGCIKYELYQYNNERCRYMVIQEWQNEAQWKQHCETALYKHFMRILPALVHEPADVKTLTRLI